MLSRPNKDQMFMEIADVVAKRSTCVKKHIGAVLEKDGYIISTGYNGSPAGLPHCTKETCTRLTKTAGTGYETCRAVHAEMNCIIQAAKQGKAIDGGFSTIYCQYLPCIDCLKAIINSGINRICFKKYHIRGKEGMEEAWSAKEKLINESNIILKLMNNE